MEIRGFFIHFSFIAYVLVVVLPSYFSANIIMKDMKSQLLDRFG